MARGGIGTDLRELLDEVEELRGRTERQEEELKSQARRLDAALKREKALKKKVTLLEDPTVPITAEDEAWLWEHESTKITLKKNFGDGQHVVAIHTRGLPVVRGRVKAGGLILAEAMEVLRNGRK